MKQLLIASLLLAGTFGSAEAAPLQKDMSEIAFKGSQMNVPVRGRFTDFSGEIHFDAAKLTAAKAMLLIKTASIDIGLDEGNDTLRSADWFSAEAFPEARFDSRSFKALDGDRYQVDGTLRIKDVRQALSVVLTIKNTADGRLEATGQFPLKRLPLKLGVGDWADTSVVADQVTILVKIVVKP